MCCFTSWNVLSGVCEGFSQNAAIYFCALNVTRRRENEASIPNWGWGRTLADIDTTVCAFHFRMYSCSDNHDMWHLFSGGNNLSDLPQCYLKCLLNLTSFLSPCTVVKVQSCQLVNASLLLL